jgi:hypothetical protein
MYRFKIERKGAARQTDVVLSRSAMASKRLPDDVEQALRTNGESAVRGVLGHDDPPRKIHVSSSGIAYE